MNKLFPGMKADRRDESSQPSSSIMTEFLVVSEEEKRMLLGEKTPIIF